MNKLFFVAPRCAAWIFCGVVLATPALAQNAPASSANAFNPAISLILDGKYAGYRLDPEAYALPGFAHGPEAELAPAGVSVQHTELVFSANVDDQFSGTVTAAIASHEGATEVELEEAFMETLGLGNGVTVKAGRFFSGFGYLNGQHGHAWDFADAPLIYRGLFGNQIIDDGVQVRWVAPTDLYVQVGAEVLRGGNFPAGGTTNGHDARTLFVKLGGDVGASHSWQLGLSRWLADSAERVGLAVDAASVAESTFNGTSRVGGVDFVWKWAPEGNNKERNLKVQMEYLTREEDGEVTANATTTAYQGKQHGAYVQAVYQFRPQWRVGARFDHVTTDNRAADVAVLAAAGLADAAQAPRRTSLMVDYSRSEFSRLRLQVSRDESLAQADRQVYLQYVMSLGAHGAHSF